MRKFVKAYEKCEKKYIFRCAASLVKVLGHIKDQPYLTKEQCVIDGKGGIVIVGSHVNKTTSQLNYLKEKKEDLIWIEFDQHKILINELNKETIRVADELTKHLNQDKTVVVATRRERVDFPDDNPEKQLEMANEISNALTGVLSKVNIKPKFIITKGGITSSDGLTKGLNVSKALVLGQIIQNVGVIKCLDGSKFINLPVVIFPGNVGDETSLFEVLSILI
ncbi:MAG: nucleotide-binding domain containing protein [Erysipelotrichaceae bacterium]